MVILQHSPLFRYVKIRSGKTMGQGMWQCSMCKMACLRHFIWVWHPPIGTWIALLGFLAAFAALTRDPKEIKRWEKAAWIFVMFFLLVLEIKTLYQDRNEHDEAEQESRHRSEENFNNIAHGIQNTIDGLNTSIAEGRQHFDKTMVGMSRTNVEQIKLARKQQEMIDSANGHLLPVGNGPAPPLESLGCEIDIT